LLEFFAGRGSVRGIMTLAEIKEEVIPKLTLAEKKELADMLAAEADDALWVAQMREDAKPGGKLARMGEEAWAAHERGETEEWP